MTRRPARSSSTDAAAVGCEAARVAHPDVAAARGRVEFVEKGLDEADAHGATSSCLATPAHLTDVVLDKAVSVRARVAVLPCCHHLKTSDTEGCRWIDRATAIDIMRAVRLGQCGYRVRTQMIPAGITPKKQAAHRRARGIAPPGIPLSAQREVHGDVMRTGMATRQAHRRHRRRLGCTASLRRRCCREAAGDTCASRRFRSRHEPVPRDVVAA